MKVKKNNRRLNTDKWKNVYPLFIAYILMILAVFILPFYSFDSYSILKNTTSHLGAQNAPNAWIMNLTFILLGIASITGGWLSLNIYKFQKIILTIFGFSLIFTGIFQHAPVVPNIPYSIKEDELHSIFASVTGFSFVVFAFSTAFIEKITLQKILALAVGVTGTGLSLLIFSVSDFAGLWQRVMFIIAFAWLIYFLKKKL